jgi:hypothetical protein
MVPFLLNASAPSLSSISFRILTSGVLLTEVIAGSTSFRCVPSLDFFLVFSVYFHDLLLIQSTSLPNERRP